MTRTKDAFTFPEILVAVVILSLLFLFTMASLSFDRIASYKEKELAILTDFSYHYLELIKGLPFEKVEAGAPVNTLYNGSAGAPDIPIPSSNAWISMETTDYQAFHPELVWLENRTLEMRVTLTTTQAGGEDHTKHIQLELRWEPPLGRGDQQTIRLDMVRVKDLP